MQSYAAEHNDDESFKWMYDGPIYFQLKTLLINEKKHEWTAPAEYEALFATVIDQRKFILKNVIKNASSVMNELYEVIIRFEAQSEIIST